MISNSSIPNCQAIELTPPLIPQAAQRSRSTIKRALPPLTPASAACWNASASAWVLVMGLTLNVICRGLRLLPELMPKKLWSPTSSLAMVDLSASLPAGGRPRRCLYSASSSKNFSVFFPYFPWLWFVPYLILALVVWGWESTGAISLYTRSTPSAVRAIAFHWCSGWLRMRSLLNDVCKCWRNDGARLV